MERMAFVHEKMRIAFTGEGHKWRQNVFQPQNLPMDAHRVFAAGMNVQVAAAGKPHGVHPGLAAGHSLLAEELVLKRMDQTEKGISLQYLHEELMLIAEVNMAFVPGAAVIRQTTTVRNEGRHAVVLTHLSSLCMQGIALGGPDAWTESGRVRVHYWRQAWSGEGQWRCDDLDRLGLYRTSPRAITHAVHWESRGSWSTGRYLPMIVIEDLATQSVWYAQVEASSHWHIELGNRYEHASIGSDSLYVQIDGASESFGGWTKVLQPGESFTAIPAAIGCCSGGIEAAVRELTAYRRSCLKPANAWQGEVPVVFNDYMNCLWADPSEGKLLPLIQRAAEVGAEVFCIDAGWFAEPQTYWGASLGDWQPNANRFGSEGLAGILHRIQQAGMIPGVWLELEVCGERAALGCRPDTWFLRRNGRRVGGGERWFMNFANPEVRACMHATIDRLTAMGVGFIKNDYNGCAGFGDDTLGSSAADGLIVHMRSFYAFLDEVRTKHPDLIIEGCASGGMRADYGMLAHVHMVSSSDQEAYTKYPSIAGGMLAAVLPEQNGIWAYPYPLPVSHLDRPEWLDDEAYIDSMQDGEQTAFNMINGLCGNLYVSGRVDKADALNLLLIKEAITLYKAERSHIRNSSPIWPIGFKAVNDSSGWSSVGLASMDNRRILLAVWRLDSEESAVRLPIPNGEGSSVEVKQLYPEAASYQVTHHYDISDGALIVNLPKRNQARLFELKKMTKNTNEI